MMQGLMFESIHLLFYIQNIQTWAMVQKWRFALMRNLIISNMLSLGTWRRQSPEIVHNFNLTILPIPRMVLEV